MIRNDLFKKLNVFSHTIYESDPAQYVVWKNQEKAQKLYTVCENGDNFDVFNSDQLVLANNVTGKMVINFIEADMDIGSPIPGSQIVSMNGNEIYEEPEFEEPEGYSSNIQSIIIKAAEKNGMASVGVSLLQDLAARKEINKKTSGVVKRKRKLDISDSDFDDDD